MIVKLNSNPMIYLSTLVYMNKCIVYLFVCLPYFIPYSSLKTSITIQRSY
jgi:hypothetical protein